MFAAYHAKAYEQAQAFLAKAEPGIRDKLTKGISGGGAADKGGRPGVIQCNLCRMNERRTSGLRRHTLWASYHIVMTVFFFLVASG